MTGTAAFADAAADAKKAIAAGYAKMDSAVAKRDLDGYLSVHAPDYVAISRRGHKSGVADMRKNLTQVFATTRSRRASTRIQKLALKGDTAVVTVAQKGEVVMVHPTDPSRFGTVHANGLTEATWVKRGGRWLMKESRELKSEARVVPGVRK
jgi:uncharacterized protein (TIGR02246 family)